MFYGKNRFKKFSPTKITVKQSTWLKISQSFSLKFSGLTNLSFASNFIFYKKFFTSKLTQRIHWNRNNIKATFHNESLITIKKLRGREKEFYESSKQPPVFDICDSVHESVMLFLRRSLSGEPALRLGKPSCCHGNSLPLTYVTLKLGQEIRLGIALEQNNDHKTTKSNQQNDTATYHEVVNFS